MPSFARADGQGPRKHEQSGLRDGVSGRLCRRAQSQPGAGKQYRSAARLLDFRSGELRAEETGLHVDIHDLVVGFFRRQLDATRAGDAGIVVEDIELAVRGHRRSHHVFDFGDLHQVCIGKECVAPVSLDRLHGLIASFSLMSAIATWPLLWRTGWR